MIRWRRPGDEASIVRLVQTQLLPISRFSGLRGRHLRRDISKRLKRGSTLVAAKSPQSEPFGFLHMEIRKPVLFIDLLAVDGAEQNRSWGTLMMGTAEIFGAGQGCTEVRLFVDDINGRGLRFYAKLGYSVVRHVPEASCYELRKPLAPHLQPAF